MNIDSALYNAMTDTERFEYKQLYISLHSTHKTMVDNSTQCRQRMELLKQRVRDRLNNIGESQR